MNVAETAARTVLCTSCDTSLIAGDPKRWRICPPLIHQLPSSSKNRGFQSVCNKLEWSCAEIFAYFSVEFLHTRGATRGQKLQSREKRSRRRFPEGMNEELWPSRGGLSHSVIRLSPNPMVVEDRPSGAFMEVIVGRDVSLSLSKSISNYQNSIKTLWFREFSYEIYCDLLPKLYTGRYRGQFRGSGV